MLTKTTEKQYETQRKMILQLSFKRMKQKTSHVNDVYMFATKKNVLV